MNNEILTSKKAVELMNGIRGVYLASEELKEKDRLMRQELLEMCDKHGIKSIDNDILRLTRVAGSESVSIDLKQVKNAEPELYNDLLAEYPKKTIRKPSVRIKIKG